ncbi:hypothetical protein M4D55_03190 [Metabacillus idriensis]|uniref:Uncharacterized protein n=1 Tax=Metabacillus idriensis TaxID=324768 RepID=A0A6I2M4V8_9BACI|nr:hypothetical protein [Metabacillus idriensis]MCM3594795.1 hypothetical protein [Metabacillus idriensis]MRX53185.1 hypothetical protein [Metabacillus idriensis]OHR66161.1 hypothetical protein HMPREF3291_12165 [Bacillus sp. HMSC76G11]
MKRFLMVMLLTLFICAGFIGLRFGSALFQEEDSASILLSILELELSMSDYAKVSEHRYVSKSTDSSGFIKEFMTEKGWTYRDQAGSGLIFEKEERSVVVETRQFSRHYILWDVPKDS